jgi:hypothetical protein
MTTTTFGLARAGMPLAVLLAWSLGAPAGAEIRGLTAMPFNLSAKVDRLVTGEGGSYLLWGYANGNGRAQYPGPTLIVNQGATVTITLTNKFPTSGNSAGQKASLVFPGQANVTATCVTGPCTDPAVTPGLLTKEAAARNSVVSYTFTASQPGTYLYHSGTSPELQVEMGLAGAIIVRPTGWSSAAPTAYGDGRSAYDRETLFFLTEIDPRIHDTVELQGVAALTATDYLSDYFPGYWFLNGRNAPDDLGAAESILYPTQPYNCVPRMHPGEKLLMRVVGAGRDQHPFHHHGNHARIIARDARMLDAGLGGGVFSGENAGPDLAHDVFTIQSVPGGTVDAIFQWTGKDLGWDIYGAPHQEGPLVGAVVKTTCDNPTGYDSQTHEWCPDHGKALPVSLPDLQNLTFGGYWGGSPFLGTFGSLPPGEGGNNPTYGYVHMWHSHTEKEITNFDIFPGGMMTFMIVEAPGVAIDEVVP